MAVRRQMRLRPRRAACPGASPSRPTTSSTAHGNYQYKAFGVPGLGLKRGLGDELVVAPYATALAAMVDPARSADEPAAARRGRRARARSASTTRSTTRARGRTAATTPTSPAGSRRRRAAYLAHHQGMTLVALANVLLGRPHGAALPRRPARPGDRAAAAGARPAQRRSLEPRPADETRGRAAEPRRRRCGAFARRTRVSRTRSSCPTATTSRSSPTRAAAPASAAGCAVTRWREDRDPRSRQPVHLPARRPQRRVWSADLPADADGAGRLPRRPSRRPGDLRLGATTTSRRSSRSPSRPRTTSRSAGCR